MRLGTLRVSTVFFLVGLPGFSQSFYGGLRGSVTDAAAAAVANARVTLIDQATGLSRNTLSNAVGEYVFSSLTPATYTVVVEAPSFKKFERRGLIVSAQQFLTLDVRLELGQVSESIQVTEEVPLIESSNASTGQVIDRQKLVDLPNLGRNPFMMSKIAQNVIPAGNPNFNRMQDQSGSSQISVAGGPVRGNNYLLDGVPITDTQNRAVIIPTIESVQEVKVQVHTYDAEMGRTGGGVFNAYLKSGSNRLTGSAFGYMRQTEWIANTYFNNRGGLPRRDQPFRNYGGSLGGPVWIPKVYNGLNRTFFYFGAEAYRQSSSVSAEFAVPTMEERLGDFSRSLSRSGGLQLIYDPLTTRSDGAGGWVRDAFPGNVIPASRLNPTGLALAKTYPVPMRPARYYADNNISVSTAQYDRADQLTAKFDHEVFSWWRATLSYLHYGSREPGENWFATTSSPAQWLLGRKVDATQFNNIVTPSATTVLSVRYGFNRFPNDSYQRSMGYNLGELGFSPAFIRTVQRPTFPNISMESISGLGVNSNEYQVYASKNFLVGLSHFVGRHSFKGGFDYRRLSITGITYGNSAGLFEFNDVFTRANPVVRTAGTGSDLAALLLGYPTVVSMDKGSPLSQYLDYYAGYFQDDFRVTPRLSLNLGLRYEYETGLKARENALIVGFDRTVVSPLPVNNGPQLRGGVMYAGVNGYPTQTGSLNRWKFSPRLGFAYTWNEKTTIRAGYGLFWAPIAYGLQTPIGYTQNNRVVSSENNTVPTVWLHDPYPRGVLMPEGNRAGLMAGIGGNVSVIDQRHESPYVHQYSIDLQRELGWGVTVMAGYVGSLGRNLVMGSGAVNINQLPPQYLNLGTSLNQAVPNWFYRPGGPGLVGQPSLTLSRALRPFPQFDQVLLLNNDRNHSRYDSFVVTAQKRAGGGVTLLATWTWSKMFDGAFGGPGNNLSTNGGYQDAYNLDAEYALSILHTPHRLSAGITYEFPFGRGKRWASQNRVLDLIAGGWSWNAVTIYQTGFPLAIRQQSNNNAIIGALNQRPNATGVSPFMEGSFAQRLDGWINPAAFRDAPAFVFGNVSRTIAMRGPGQANWDMSIFKTFTVTERLRAQFRAEALNAMNTPLFRAPETRVGNANFGKVTSQANFPRMMQLGLRFFF